MNAPTDAVADPDTTIVLGVSTQLHRMQPRYSKIAFDEYNNSIIILLTHNTDYFCHQPAARSPKIAYMVFARTKSHGKLFHNLDLIGPHRFSIMFSNKKV